MAKRSNEGATHELRGVRGRFERWRSERRGQERIPEELWRAAGGLVGPTMSAAGVARELGLDSGKLARRVREMTKAKASRGVGLRRRKARPTFVEVSRGPSRMPGWEVQGSPGQGALLELARADGTVLRLYAQAVRGPEVAELIGRFVAPVAR